MSATTVLLLLVLALFGESEARPSDKPQAGSTADARTTTDVAELIAGLESPDADTHLKAGEALLELAPTHPDWAEAVASAVARCNPIDPDDDVRRFGRRALLRMGNTAMPAVIAHLPEDDLLLAALAEPGDTASIGPLVGLIAANKALSRDADGWSDQTGVKQALLMIGPSAIAGPLTKALDENRDSLALLVAVSSLAGPDFDDAAPLLSRYLADESEGRCILAAAALVRIGDASLPELRAALKDRSRRAPAMYAISQLGPQANALADALFDLAKDDAAVTNEVVLAQYGKVVGQMTVGELAMRALEKIEPPADRFLELNDIGQLRRMLDDGIMPIYVGDLRQPGKRLADMFAHALSPESTAERVEKKCREAVERAGGDKAKERAARWEAIFDERFVRTRMAAAWSRVAPEDGRVVDAVLRLIGEADYHIYPIHDHGCGGIDWPELLFLREAVRRRPEAYLPRLREMLAGDVVDRTKALYLFAHLGPYGDEAVDAAYATLDSELFDARKAAMLVLIAHAPRSEKLVGALLERYLIEQDDTDTKYIARPVIIRGKKSLTKSLPKLMEALNASAAVPDLDESRLRARRAANVLSLVGPPAKAASPTLLRMAQSAERTDREAAIRALGAIAADAETVVPFLADRYLAARKRTLQANALPFQPEGKFSGPCEPALCLHAIGCFGPAAKAKSQLLLNAALKKPEIEIDPKTGERKPVNGYETQIAVEGAIALGRIGGDAREALPKLREANLRRDFDSEDLARQLAVSIAVARINGEKATDIATVVELLRTARARDVHNAVGEELVVLAKRHPEVACGLRRVFLRCSRPSRESDSFNSWETYYTLDETMSLAPFVRAAVGSDRACCERLEEMLAAELPKQDPLLGNVADILSLLREFECRSPRLAEILRSADGYDDPEIRWRAAAMLKTISPPPNQEP